jgi:hypothetical protein
MERKEIAEPLPHRKFLEGLLAMGKGKTTLSFSLSPSARDFIGVGAGISGVHFRYVVGEDRCRVEFFIARPDKAANKRFFDELHFHKGDVDAAFGERLKWERLDDSKSCRIAYPIFGGVKDNESRWRAIQISLVDAMVRLEKSLLPLITEMRG